MLSPDGIVPLAAGEADVAGADVAGADELDELDELEDEQPAAAKATTAAAATQPSRGKRLPPSLLLPSRIPTPFGRISQGGTPYNTCVPSRSNVDGRDIKHQELIARH